MSFLSALLPGLRDLRAPFAVGCLWLAVLALWFYPLLATTSDYVVMTDIVTPLMGSLPAALKTAAAALAAYLFGVLAVSTQGAIGHGLSNLLLEGRLHSLLPKFLRTDLEKALRLPGPAAEALIQNSISERIRPISTTLAALMPTGLVLDEFHLASLKLSKDSADQYQQYDRVRAEAEFRLGVALPVGALGISLGIMLPPREGWAVGILSAAIAVALALQGVRHARKADELLASAIYFGFTSTPMLDALVESAKTQLAAGRANAVAKDAAWLCDYLADRGLLSRYRAVVLKMRHPSRARKLFFAAAPYMSAETRRAVVFALTGKFVSLDDVAEVFGAAGADNEKRDQPQDAAELMRATADS